MVVVEAVSPIVWMDFFLRAPERQLPFLPITQPLSGFRPKIQDSCLPGYKVAKQQLNYIRKVHSCDLSMILGTIVSL